MLGCWLDDQKDDVDALTDDNYDADRDVVKKRKKKKKVVVVMTSPMKISIMY